jgi:cation/acetate symporter
MFVYTLSLMIGTAGLPHVIMRFFTVPSVKDARSSAGWALVFIAILYTTAPGRGRDGQAQPAWHGQYRRHEGRRPVRARSQHQGRRPSGLDEALGKDRPAEVRPTRTATAASSTTTTTKNADAKAKAAAAGWKGNELTVNADIIVLANPEIALLPNWVIALVAAGGLAAALSTAAGLLMAISPPSRMT